MTKKWVGWIVCLVLLASSIGLGSATAEYREQFVDPSNTDWIGVSGLTSVEQSHGSSGRVLHYLQLDGNGEGDLDYARAHVDPAATDTTLTGYEVIAVIERDPDYDEVGSGPGWFGITFGEANESHFIAGLDNDEFFIADATGSGFSKVWEQEITAEDWASVPNVPEHRQDDGVDQRLRYTLQVLGTTVSLKVNGYTLGTTELPRTANGQIGLAADTGTRIHAQEVIHRMLDPLPPLIDIYRPVNNTVYINDMEIPEAFTGGPAIVLGELTLGADVLDGGIGVENAHLLVDGQYVPGSRTTQTGFETNWTVDTSVLDFGYHDFTVRASDRGGNIAEASVRFLVISHNVQDQSPSDVEDALEQLLP